MSAMIIKVCGMREQENIRNLEMLDIDYMGFIFYARSPRYIPDNSTSVDAVRSCKKHKVGVFVNETLENILYKAKRFTLDSIQLHGREQPKLCAKLQEKGYSVIKAFAIASTEDFKPTLYFSECADYFLFDTPYRGYGGSGKRFDWSLLEVYKENVPFFLSGGLSPGCEKEILQLKNPHFAGVDLNSGFEDGIAIKNIEKISSFVRKIRNLYK